MWDLVPWLGQGLNPGPLHWECRGLSHWTTREVPYSSIFEAFTFLSGVTDLPQSASIPVPHLATSPTRGFPLQHLPVGSSSLPSSKLSTSGFRPCYSTSHEVPHCLAAWLQVSLLFRLCALLDHTALCLEPFPDSCQKFPKEQMNLGRQCGILKEDILWSQTDWDFDTFCPRELASHSLSQNFSLF